MLYINILFCNCLGHFIIWVVTSATEMFIPNQCMTFPDDVIDIGLSYRQCVQQCDNTDMCMSVSYKHIMSVCKMHIQVGAPTDCQGYLFTQKSKWTRIPLSCSCREEEVDKKCPMPVAPPNGKLVGNVFSESGKVKVMCNKGFVVDGEPRKCKAGVWDGDETCIEDPNCNQYMVSGENGVPDSQLSESSNWCQATQNPVCLGDNTMTSVMYARLRSEGHLTGGWYAGDKTGTQYVQVDFLQPRVISAVMLQGRHFGTNNIQQWVTEFKLLLSDDCSSFTPVLDDGGSEKVFTGTTGADDIVVRPLPERQPARCVRLQPTLWMSYPSLRFDILGC